VLFRRDARGRPHALRRLRCDPSGRDASSLEPSPVVRDHGAARTFSVSARSSPGLDSRGKNAAQSPSCRSSAGAYQTRRCRNRLATMNQTTRLLRELDANFCCVPMRRRLDRAGGHVAASRSTGADSSPSPRPRNRGRSSSGHREPSAAALSGVTAEPGCSSLKKCSAPLTASTRSRTASRASLRTNRVADGQPYLRRGKLSARAASALPQRAALAAELDR